MNKQIVRAVMLSLSVFTLISCDKNNAVEMPQAKTLTRDANGYYCLMTVVYHKGPKGQIILSDNKVNWFTSVRDTISFTLSPEEPKNIAAIYVNDMSNAEWDNPGYDNWIDATKAWYVIDSGLEGGMGAPETIPFSTKENAEKFAKQKGGQVYAFSDIPRSYVMDVSD